MDLRLLIPNTHSSTFYRNFFLDNLYAIKVKIVIMFVVQTFFFLKRCFKISLTKTYRQSTYDISKFLCMIKVNRPIVKGAHPEAIFLTNINSPREEIPFWT